MCYSGLVGTVASRALRNDTRGVLRRVQQGEPVTITVDGYPVAVLQPVAAGRRWLPRADFVSAMLARQADSALTQELAALAPDTTDTLPL